MMGENIDILVRGAEPPPFAVTFDCKDGRKTVVFEEDGLDELFKAFLAFLDMYIVAYKIVTR